MKNDPLLMEIQDEINRENMVRFVNKYAKLLVAAGILFFIGVAAFQFWQQYRVREATRAGSEVYKIMRDMDGKPQGEPALKTLETTSHSPGYYEISLLNKAQIQLRNNDYPGAIASFDAAAKNGDNKPLRDLAALQSANLLLNNNPKAEGLEKRLAALSADDNSYKYNARELLAVFYIENGENEKAAAILNKLAADPGAPVTIAKRARELKAQTTNPADNASENEED